MEIIYTTCDKCGGNMEVNMETMTTKCQYCGTTGVIDQSKIQKLLIEKEKTKRKQMGIEADKESTKNTFKLLFVKFPIIYVGLFILVIVLVALAVKFVFWLL